MTTIKEEIALLDLDEQVKYADNLVDDARKGVQNIRQRIYKQEKKRQGIIDKYQRLSAFELEGYSNGYLCIGGIDEAGRGPLAGPVVAACVVLDPKKAILGLDDSKKLSLPVREALFDEIMEHALHVGVGIVKADRIDDINILNATKEAMIMAVKDLDVEPDYLLIDAVKLDNLTIDQNSMYKGDELSNSIAAASVIAKVTRDRMMVNYNDEFPGYGFVNNKGYGTSEHYDGLREQGMTPIHRRSFLKSL